MFATQGPGSAQPANPKVKVADFFACAALELAVLLAILLIISLLKRERPYIIIILINIYVENLPFCI